MRFLLIWGAFLVGCASAQYVKSGVKGGYGGQREYHGGDNLVKIFSNSTQHGLNTNHNTVYNNNIGDEKGVCYQEVPTASLVRDPAHVPAGNGSRPDLSRIRACCHGYIKNIYNNRICEPVCTKECVNALCTAPETCSCFPDHVKNAAGICIATCPIGCQNGHCAGGECLCKEGFRLDIDGKFCVPICRDNCGGLGNCTSPNTCECRPGYQSTPDGSCSPAGVASGCGRCTNGDCVSNECRCRQGYLRDQQGLCVPQCSKSCGPGESCIYPNVCSYANTGIQSANPTSSPLNQSSNYPYNQGSSQGPYPGSNQFFNPYNSNPNLPSYPHGYRPSNPQNPGQNSNPTYPNQYPGQNPNSTYHNQYPGQNPNTTYPNQYPGQNPNPTYPSQYPGQNPNTTYPNQYPGQNPNPTYPNQYPGQNPNTTYPNQYPGQNPNPTYPNQYPGQVPNPNYPNQNSGYNPNHGIPNSGHPSSPNQGSSYHPSYPSQDSNHPYHPDQKPNSPSQGSQYPYPNNQGLSQPTNGSSISPSSNPDAIYVVNIPNQPGYPNSLNQVVNSSYSLNQSNYSSTSNQSSNPSYPSNQGPYHHYPSNQGSNPSYPSNQGPNPHYPSNQGSNPHYPSNQGSNPSYPSNQGSNPSYPSNQGPNSHYPSNQGPNPHYPSNQGSNPTYPSSPNYPYYNQGSYPYTTQIPNNHYPYSSDSDCGQPCINGVCYGGRCSCYPGYELDRTDTSGHTCQRVKPTGCVMECISPDVCICKMGYHRPPGVKA